MFLISLFVFVIIPGSIYTCLPLLFFSESVRKVLDKQPIKFVRAVKQDLRSGKTEDRILVRRGARPPLVVVVVVEIFAVKLCG